MTVQLLVGFLLFTILHVFVWFSMNVQFMNSTWAEKSLAISIALAIPLSLVAYYAGRNCYQALEHSAWSVRFIGFGTSYLVFPVMTWWLLGESMFTGKTLVCIVLSVMIMCTQIFWR